MSPPTRCKALVASRYSAARSMIPKRCGSCPSITFEPTSRSLAWINSWRTRETPSRMASAGLCGV